MAKQKKTAIRDHKQGFNSFGGFLVQVGKELSSIPAYAARELTGQPHNKRIKCRLKKGWFE